jgi:catechol 2,3-dioxygenase-like lactoylglutathione lyase family enzyme
MKATVDFLAKVGIPLVKTSEVPNGIGQHFFFDIGGGDSLAYFWWADHLAVPRVSGSEMYDGAMHHVAFTIELKDLQGWWDRLVGSGTPFSFVAHQIDGTMNIQNDLSAVDTNTWAASLYFNDPDGNQLEFCAWGPAWDRMSIEHEPETTLREDRRVERIRALPGSPVGAPDPQFVRN